MYPNTVHLGSLRYVPREMHQLSRFRAICGKFQYYHSHYHLGTTVACHQIPKPPTKAKVLVERGILPRSPVRNLSIRQAWFANTTTSERSLCPVFEFMLSTSIFPILAMLMISRSGTPKRPPGLPWRSILESSALACPVLNPLWIDYRPSC
jgi:hypothetical protein